MEHHGYMISEELYKWILDNLEHGKTILEIGSGDGTKLLSEYYKMYSIEHNPQWQNKYNSTYINAPLIGGWYHRETLEREMPKNYDLILVDAPPAFTVHARYGFYSNLDLFRTDVPIIIDDTNREGEKKLADDLSKRLGRPYEEFKCNQKSFAVFMP